MRGDVVVLHVGALLALVLLDCQQPVRVVLWLQRLANGLHRVADPHNLLLDRLELPEPSRVELLRLLHLFLSRRHVRRHAGQQPRKLGRGTQQPRSAKAARGGADGIGGGVELVLLLGDQAVAQHAQLQQRGAHKLIEHGDGGGGVAFAVVEDQIDVDDGRARRGGLGEVVRDDAVDDRPVDGPLQEVVHAHLRVLLRGELLGHRAHAHDRDRAQEREQLPLTLHTADLGCGLAASHDGHVHVHQHEVVLGVGDAVARVQAVVREVADGLRPLGRA
mmetsp:Transcript_29623/g.81390  ORF Transcript_29623/g.81390 Transcript_29623/m.81390 type:complete len:276 (+) Transcript_29623:357-1184(+)